MSLQYNVEVQLPKAKGSEELAQGLKIKGCVRNLTLAFLVALLDLTTTLADVVWIVGEKLLPGAGLVLPLLRLLTMNVTKDLTGAPLCPNPASTQC